MNRRAHDGAVARVRANGSLGQRAVLAASLWVAASLALAVGTLWWQARQVGGVWALSLPLLAPSVGFALVSAGLRTLRWHAFLGAVGARPPIKTSMHAWLVGFSMTMTPGKVGEIYKCHLIEQRTGVPMARTAPIVLFEKGMDAIAFALLALTAAAMLPGLADSISASARTLIGVGIAGAFAVFLLHRARPDDVATVVLRAVGRFRLGRRMASWAVMALAGSLDLLRPALLTRSMALSLAARTCDGMCLAWAVWALGIQLPALAGVFALNSSGAIGGLSMLPGGIGIVETSITLLLTRFGVTAAAALAGTLIARFLTFWMWVAAGLILLIASIDLRGADPWPGSTDPTPPSPGRRTG